VLDTKLTPVAFAPPIDTVAPETNPVPVIVTVVPPNSVPALAAMLVTVGAALIVYVALDTEESAQFVSTANALIV
jgi:hypothetical protein